jgi:hypothetical protein
MKRFLALLSLSFFLGTGAYAQSEPTPGTLPVDIPTAKEKLLKAAIKNAIRLFTDLDFTSILIVPADTTVSPHLGGSDPESKFPVNLPAKAIVKLKTAGLFNNLKVKWDLKSRGLGTVTSAEIHCKTLTGDDRGVGVTLVPKGLCKDSWRCQHGTVTEVDEANECGWNNMLDTVLAMELNRAYINIKTVENPAGELVGDITNIGF